MSSLCNCTGTVRKQGKDGIAPENLQEPHFRLSLNCCVCSTSLSHLRSRLNNPKESNYHSYWFQIDWLKIFQRLNSAWCLSQASLGYKKWKYRDSLLSNQAGCQNRKWNFLKFGIMSEFQNLGYLASVFIILSWNQKKMFQFYCRGILY